MRIWFFKAPVPAVNAPPIRDQVSHRIRRLANRFAALIARVIDGTLPAPRPRKPRVPLSPIDPEAARAEATHKTLPRNPRRRRPTADARLRPPSNGPAALSPA